MNERKQIKEILKRLELRILYEDETSISFETHSYGDIDIEFDENNLITKIFVDM